MCVEQVKNRYRKEPAGGIPLAGVLFPLPTRHKAKVYKKNASYVALIRFLYLPFDWLDTSSIEGRIAEVKGKKVIRITPLAFCQLTAQKFP
nr:MAG TPA: hypothetical protein [Caudoviricetes sp.]